MANSVIFYNFAVICASIVLRDDLNANAKLVALNYLASETHMLTVELTSYLDKIRATFPEELADKKRKILTVVEESQGAIQRKVEAAMSQNSQASYCLDQAQLKIDEHKAAASKESDQCITAFLDHMKVFLTYTILAEEASWKLSGDINVALQKCSDAALTPYESETCFQDENEKLRPTFDYLKTEAIKSMYEGYDTANVSFKESEKWLENINATLKSNLANVDVDVDACIAAT